MFGGWRIVKTMGQRITKIRRSAASAPSFGLGRAVSRDRPRHPGLDHAHHPGSIVGVGSTQSVSAGALGRRRQHRLGVDPDDPCSAFMAVAWPWWLARIILSSQRAPEA
jgi:hypothetical protein